MFETPTDCYDKPVLTLSSLLAQLPGVPLHLARVAPTAVGYPISSALRERIMLAVTAVNRCFYCRVAHTTFGRSAGLSDLEIESILQGADPDGDPGEELAVSYARDLARRGFASRDEALYARLADHFSPAEQAAIDSSARVINLANRFGNTFDAARERLAGRCEQTEADGMDMTLLSGLFVTGAALVAPLVGALMLAHKVTGR